MLALLLALHGTAAAATITVVNGDGADEGFNDPTAATPVGDNPGTTLGAQRLNAFTHAANLWGALLTSAVTIRVNATMDVLSCSMSSATLGSAGANTVHYNFTNAPYANTYYPQALANKIAGGDLSGINDITAYFNSAIGTTCAFPKSWYYGLDGNPAGDQIDFVTVVMHEIGHGLGFQTYVTTSTGARFNDRDDIYMKFLEDHSLGLGWGAMNDAQRATSAVDTSDLHWTGSAVVAAGGSLSAGRHAGGHVQMYAPASIVSGSSVSHWDTALSPNEMMEPSYTTDMTDPSLARDLMTDLGWDFATTTTTTSSTSSSTTTSSTTSTSTTTTSTTTTSIATTTSSSSPSTSTSSSTSSSTSTSTSSTTTSTSTSSSTTSSSTSTSTSTTTSTTVPVVCTASPETFTDPTITPLADAGVTTATIVVSGAGAHLLDVDVTTFLAHPSSDDLDVTITSPAGTTVTLTSDNAVGFADVFEGTTWDDGADADGDLPYETNDGIATDTDYGSGGVQPWLTPEEALGAFVGENPNGTWTLTISDDAAGNAGSLDGWSLAVTALPDAVASSVTSFTNATPLAIPSGPAVVSSTIVVSGVLDFLVDLDVHTVMPHTYSSDLDVTLTSPAGTVVTLTSDNAPGVLNAFAGTLWDDDADPTGQMPYASNARLVTDRAFSPSGAVSPLVPEEPLAAFVGEDPNGTWTITISDDAADDDGTLSQWRLDVQTGACLPPSTTSTITTTTTTSITTSTTTTTSTTPPTSSTTTSTTSTSTTSSSAGTTSSSTTTVTTTSSSTSATATTTSTSSTTTSSAASTTSTTTTSTTSTTFPAEQAGVCAPAPLASCRVGKSQRSSVLLRNGAHAAKDVLKWKMTHGGPSSPADVVRDGVTLALCIYDAGSPPLLLSSGIPTTGTCSGKPCWKPMAGGFRYRNKAAAPNGIVDLKLQASGLAELGVVMKGKGALLAVPSLGLTLPVRMQLVATDGDATTCWESSFGAALKNDGAQLKANGS
jgi:subtilisin-like proprotein convertase family protein